MASIEKDEPKKPSGVYSSFLKLDQLLSLQQPKTDVHDEVLFIILHQAYELWFKEILHDVDSVRKIFHGKLDWREIQFHTAINRLQRVAMIIRHVVEQFHILETMYPQNFVEFRDSLIGASGFQSLQFRKIEKLLGINDAQRQKHEEVDYKDRMDSKDKNILLEYPDEEGGGTLLNVIDIWLSTTPGIDDVRFWKSYKENKRMSGMDSFLVERVYNQEREKGHWRLSRRSLQGALLIMMHQDKPEFQQPYQLLSLLMDVDVALMKWRSTHIHMVHRMLGQKEGSIGNTGKAGYDYLRATYSDDYKVFRDLFILSNYLRPRNEIPPLDTSL